MCLLVIIQSGLCASLLPLMSFSWIVLFRSLTSTLTIKHMIFFFFLFFSSNRTCDPPEQLRATYPLALWIKPTFTTAWIEFLLGEEKDQNMGTSTMKVLSVCNVKGAILSFLTCPFQIVWKWLLVRISYSFMGFLNNLIGRVSLPASLLFWLNLEHLVACHSKISVYLGDNSLRALPFTNFIKSLQKQNNEQLKLLW